MLRVVLDTEHPADTVWVNETRGDEVVLLIEVAPVGDSERLVVDRVTNGTPDVNDADTAGQKAFSLFAKVVMHALNASIERLVYVDTLLQSQIFRFV